ncbi:phage tail tip fiber protein [Pseudomonas sp. A014]|uniref:phage tail tip fiber protein n=1 Tax=Pseudomonas sp. A014 TaxID=3458058 RepID=UPI0040353E54
MSGGVRKIAQIAVGAVIGFAQGGPIGAAIGAGLAFYASEQQEKLNTKSPLRDNEPSAQTVRSSKAPARFILGKVSTGGVLVWAQEEAGAQRDGEWLHLVYVLCEGAVDALEEIYLGEEVINTYGADATYELVVNPTQVNAFLKANCPDWKDEQIGRGLSFVRLSLRYNAEKFPSGIPDARFVVRGRNDLYDPRTGMAGYSENTALHILWFLRTRCGVPDDEIVFETFASGANVCDESVANPDGTTSPRYRSSCVIGADEQRTNVLQKLEAACGGKVIRVGGRWMFQAGAYYGPWDFEITEDMVIGTITGSTEPTNDAAINTIRGTFTDTTQSWTETDYPEVSVAEWVVADGGEAAETLTFSYVTNPYQAQRLANIELRRRRAGGVINVPLNLLGYNCRPGRAVRANLPSLNILGEFIVTGWSMGTSEGCTASLQVYDPAIFDDAVGKPYNPIGFISLPSNGLGSPTGLVWTVDDTAEVTQGVLNWSAPVGIVTGYAVTVRQAGVAVQAQQVPETTLQVPLAGLASGNYTMSVAALGPQARSGEASITVNIDGPPVPEGCIVQASLDTITLTPTNVQHKLNGGTYEYFYTRDGSAPVGQAEYLGQGLSLTHTGLAFFANYFYFIRARNAYGISGYLKVPASTSNDVSNMLDALDGQIREGHLYPELAERIDLIDGNGPGSVNERIGELRDEIDDLVDALAYDPNKAYADGDSVRRGQRLYQAIQAVPAAPGGENAPPNPTYWLDIGQVVEAANGLAAQVERNTASIEEQDGRITVNAERLAAVRSELDDPVTGLSATANGLSSMKSEVETIDGKLNATAERLDGVYVQVNPALAGTTDGFAGSEQTLVGVWSEQSARIEDGVATARRLDVVQAQQGETNASVQRVDQAVVGLGGKVSAMSSWKTETNVNGKQVATGIVQGSDGQVGEILLSADRVAIINGINGPESNLFVFQNGQLFLNQALINTAFIREIILGMTLRSQAVDAFGRPLIELNMVNGTFSFRGADGNGSLLINNGGIYVYDLNYIERAALGKLT